MNNAQLTGLRGIHTGTTQPVTLAFTREFTREFTRGTLAGMTHEDSIGFCRALDAEEWVSSVNAASRNGKIDYKVIAWKVVGP